MAGFGRTLKQHREARGLSLRQLAAHVHVTFSHISKVERGLHPANAQFAQLCDDALHADGALIAAFEDNHAGGDMRRRQVLRTLGALAAAPAVAPLVGLEALRHGLDAAADVHRDEWDRIVDDYARDFYTASAPQLVEQLHTDLTVLQHLLGATPHDRALLRAAAHLSAIMAMGMSSAGHTTMARRWWRTARAHADTSADVDARVWVRDWEVVNGTYERRPVPLILDRADEAVRIAAGRVCVGHVGVLSGQAQALAVAGREAEAVAALAACAAMTERLPASAVDAADSMLGWPEVRLRHTESFVYTHLGRDREAIAAQDRALELYPVELGRERAQMQMHRAACLIRGGHVTDGLRYAAQVLDDLPHDDHNALLYQVAAQVVTVVPEAERRRVEVTELRERLTALPAG